MLTRWRRQDSSNPNNKEQTLEVRTAELLLLPKTKDVLCSTNEIGYEVCCSQSWHTACSLLLLMMRDVFCSSILLAIMTILPKLSASIYTQRYRYEFVGFLTWAWWERSTTYPSSKKWGWKLEPFRFRVCRPAELLPHWISSTSDSYVSPEINEFLLWRCTNCLEVVAVPRLIVSSKVCIALSWI